MYASSGVKAAYVNWYTGEPNNHGTGEDCVELGMDVKEGRRSTHDAKDESWNDIPCDYKLPFVCQMH